jgi:hypothetical protein
MLLQVVTAFAVVAQLWAATPSQRAAEMLAAMNSTEKLAMM